LTHFFRTGLSCRLSKRRPGTEIWLHREATIGFALVSCPTALLKRAVGVAARAQTKSKAAAHATCDRAKSTAETTAAATLAQNIRMSVSLSQTRVFGKVEVYLELPREAGTKADKDIP
jgi:hypothetical protein